MENNSPKLSVLMAALRERPWKNTFTQIKDQASEFPGKVEVLYDLGPEKSGVKRQRLLERSRGEYIAYIDDDDELCPAYAEHMLKGCDSGASVVTFNLRMTNEKNQHTETWQFGVYPNHRNLGLMCVNHLCAWRREIATKVAWCPHLGYHDVSLWYEPLLRADLIDTQYHIQKQLYYYKYNPNTTANQTPRSVRVTRKYIGHGIDCYMDSQRNIFISEPAEQSRESCLVVRDCHNNILQMRESGLKCFHKVKF